VNGKLNIYVWDPLIRIFHWSLVVLFVIAYLSGEEESSIHTLSGYGIIGLLVFRLVWGFIGSTHARFSDFMFSPARVTVYLKSLFSNRPDRYAGHNPAGAYMIYALLLMLVVVSYTGLKVYGLEGHGPLANATEVTLIERAMADENEEHEKHDGDEEFWEEIHETASNLTVLLVIIHILGVILASWQHRENLIKAMITGRKSHYIDET
jgi:cytochrome b